MSGNTTSCVRSPSSKARPLKGCFLIGRAGQLRIRERRGVIVSIRLDRKPPCCLYRFSSHAPRCKKANQNSVSFCSFSHGSGQRLCRGRSKVLPVGLTYVTGALSRFGRGLGRWGDGRPQHAVDHSDRCRGSACCRSINGRRSGARSRDLALWVPSLACLLLTVRSVPDTRAAGKVGSSKIV